jgi:hypothetical protein
MEFLADSFELGMASPSAAHAYTVKIAVKLLDVPSKNNSLMMKKYNTQVELLFLYTHVLFFQLCYRVRNFDIRTV